MNEAPLLTRYPASTVSAFDREEALRFLDSDGRPRDAEQVAWQLLYRLEPELYDRLIAGEQVHQGLLEWLPVEGRRVLEVGAGSGRLTLALAGRCADLTAVEPAAPLRARLRRRLDEAGFPAVTVRPGFFDALPVAPASQDVVISLSAFSPHREREPDTALSAMESACVDGGMVVLVWPDDVSWLRLRGYSHRAFEGPMEIVYPSVAEAVHIARIFYPQAATAVEALASPRVDYRLLGMNPPRDVCWKRCASR